jgi:hypothetical protein
LSLAQPAAFSCYLLAKERLPTKAPDSNIVADGAQRLRDARDYPSVRARLLADAMRRCDEDLKRASLVGRVWLKAKVRREVHAELKKIFPPSAFHAAASQK